MVPDLQQHIEAIPLVDTHEHMKREAAWVENGPDILQDLFGNYVHADLRTAGATPEALGRLLDGSDSDISSRFLGIEEAWRAAQFTGYGEAVRLIGKHVYGLDEFTADGLDRVQSRIVEFRKEGERYRLLHDVANIDHVQTDDSTWQCAPDKSGLDFFLYDLSWQTFCSGDIDPELIYNETGIEVKSISSLRQAMASIFERNAPYAIAVKTLHAYRRTLGWTNRSDADAELALERILCRPKTEIGVSTDNCLGDWCWAQGVELSIEYNLPFKIHTGYYAGNNRMPVRRIHTGNMCDLFARYVEARFVLMHIAYPYCDELTAIAKHYSNIWVDLCWAWSIDPYSSRDFVRKFIHAVPINKLFAFGGDTSWPTNAMAYAIQARHGICGALEAEVSDGYLSEKQAMGIASNIMYKNQYTCFDVEGTRENIRALG